MTCPWMLHLGFHLDLHSSCNLMMLGNNVDAALLAGLVLHMVWFWSRELLSQAVPEPSQALSLAHWLMPVTCP